MTKMISAAPTAPVRRNDETVSLTGYLLGSGIFVAAVLGLFSIAGFHF